MGVAKAGGSRRREHRRTQQSLVTCAPSKPPLRWRRFGRVAVCRLLRPPNPAAFHERDTDASASIDAPPLPDNRPPPAFAPSGVPYLPGASATTDPRSTPSMQPMTRQSTVSGAVGAGQPAADRENVDGGPTQEMVASELEQPATPATTDDADARVTVPPGNAVNGQR